MISLEKSKVEVLSCAMKHIRYVDDKIMGTYSEEYSHDSCNSVMLNLTKDPVTHAIARNHAWHNSSEAQK